MLLALEREERRRGGPRFKVHFATYTERNLRVVGRVKLSRGHASYHFSASSGIALMLFLRNQPSTKH